MKRLFRLILLLMPVSFVVNASPVIHLCVNDCKEQLPYQISEASWQASRDLFESGATDAATERRQLAKAVALLERDMIQQTTSYTGDDSGDELEDLFTNRDQARNTGKLIALMIDNRLITRHVLRRTEKRESVFGYSQYAAIIQSRDNSRIYAVYVAGSDLGDPPLLEELSRWKEGTPVKTLISGVKHLFFKKSPVEAENKSDDSE
jgi:hypothetical protein